MVGKTVCYNHGGKTPRGIALPQTKHGRYSKHLPTRMMATYEVAKMDPDLLALQDEVALIDARLVDLLRRVDTGESGQAWKSLNDEHRQYKRFLAMEMNLEAAESLFRISELLEAGATDEATWNDIRLTVEHRRKLVESERKRLVEMQMVVSADQAMLLVRSLVASVRQHVHDPAVLRAITDDLGRISLERAN